MTEGRRASRRERDQHDRQQRHTAALIQRDHPSWVIMYGPWSREFWAYSTLPAPPGQGLVLSSPDPNDLAAQIRQAENAAAARAPLSDYRDDRFSEGEPMTCHETITRGDPAAAQR